MGARDSERGQMAASLRWYANANSDPHGNGNRYSYRNTYSHS